MISLARGWFGKGDLVEIRRGGYNWALDLHEGIDFSIFLLGGFEPRTLRLYRKLLGRQEGEIVLDIGANIGAHTLPLAKLVACRNIVETGTRHYILAIYFSFGLGIGI